MARKCDLKKLCKLVRQDVLTISHNAHMGHVGSSFSVIEILVVLYFSILNVSSKEPRDPNRDRFILSKGHAAAALFSVLFQKGFISKKEIETFCKNDSRLLVHPEWNGLSGVEHGTGSLGHGLSVAVGMAYAAKLLGKKFRVFVLVSDAEIQEGSAWEAALFAAHHKLDNLVVVLDYNGTQALGQVKEILDIDPIEKKWQAFNFETASIDGHDLKILTKTFKKFYNEGKSPKIVIAKTVMGKGVSFMENDFCWHYYDLKSEHMTTALKELEL
jgi:transketolase